MRGAMRFAALTGLLVPCAVVAAGAPVEGFPTRSIRMITPFTPGGPTDFFARTIAQKLTDSLGKQVVVDNRAGASGIIGTELVAKAPPDGHTLLFMATHHAINPSLYKKLPYDSVKDFTPITLACSSPSIWVAHPSFPPNTMGELIALAKSRPGKVSFATSAVGGGNHLAGELFKSMARIDILHIPYKGQAQPMNDLLAGQVPLMVTSGGFTLQHIKAGKLKALGVTSPRRLATMPEVPAIAETLPGYAANSWWGIWGPAELPKEILARLNTEIVKILHSTEVRKKFADMDAEASGNSPEEFASYQKSEMEKWAKLLKEIKLQVE